MCGCVCVHTHIDNHKVRQIDYMQYVYVYIHIHTNKDTHTHIPAGKNVGWTWYFFIFVTLFYVFSCSGHINTTSGKRVNFIENKKLYRRENILTGPRQLVGISTSSDFFSPFSTYVHVHMY